MAYNWEIKGLIKNNVNEFTDVITNIIFRITSTNETNTIVIYDGNVQLDLSNLDTQTFLNLNQLNNDILLEWLQTSVKNDERYWNHINEFIDNQHRIKNNQSSDGVKIDPL